MEVLWVPRSLLIRQPLDSTAGIAHIGNPLGLGQPQRFATWELGWKVHLSQIRKRSWLSPLKHIKTSINSGQTYKKKTHPKIEPCPSSMGYIPLLWLSHMLWTKFLNDIWSEKISAISGPGQMSRPSATVYGATPESKRQWTWSLDWFKGKSTGNHGFLPSNIGRSCKFSQNPILWHDHPASCGWKDYPLVN